MSNNYSNRRTLVGGAERKDLGDPYAIYTEVVNAGKNVQGTKKKVKWLFGFTESNEEYEVVLVHSLVSGKKTVFENGVEVVSSASLMTTDFSHGWSSMQTHRLYRIEVTMQITSEQIYIFSIDGLPFGQLPDKGLMRARSMAKIDTSRYGSEVKDSPAPAPSTMPTRRSSLGASATNMSTSSVNNTSNSRMIASNASTPRSNFQSPSQKDFDPFAANSNTDSFDPFAAPSNATPPQTQRGQGKTHNSSNVSLLDGIGTDNTFDAFGQSSDPFGSSNTATNSSASAGFDAFGSNSKATTLPPKAAKPAPRTSKPAFDAFADEPSFSQPVAPVTATVDLFAPTAPVADSRPAHQRSSLQIAEDFAGMSFEVPAPVAKPAPVAEFDPFDSGHSSSAPIAKEAEKAAPADPWATGLVDLDLSGRSQQQTQKRSSNAGSGPSLDNLLGVATSQQATRRSSLNAGAGPQLTPTELLNSMNDPFGAPALLSAAHPHPHPNQSYGYGQPMAPAPMGGGYGPPMAPPMGGGGYGAPRGPMQQQQPMGMTNPGPMGHRGSIGPGMAGGPMGGGIRPSYAAGNAIPQPGMQPKSSLDTLDWKS